MARNTPSSLGWLAIKPQGPVHLCLLSSTVTSKPHHTQIFPHGFWGSNSGPQACKASIFPLSYPFVVSDGVQWALHLPSMCLLQFQCVEPLLLSQYYLRKQKPTFEENSSINYMNGKNVQARGARRPQAKGLPSASDSRRLIPFLK